MGMDLWGLLLTVIVAAAAAVGGQYILARYVKVDRNLLVLFVLGLLGAYGGSELFTEEIGTVKTISEWGPEVGGFFILTGIVGALIMTLPTAYAMRRKAAKQPTDVASYGIRDPQVAHVLFADTRVAAFWLGVRLYVGAQWLAAGVEKARETGWLDGGAALKGYWANNLKAGAGTAHPTITYGWYRDFLQYMLDHQWYTWFAKAVTFGEILIGIGLIVGCLVGFAAFFGALMNFNFMLAGSASTNPVLFGLAVLLILAWKVAGYYGVDRYLLPMLGAPWSPGRAFRHEPAPA
ncbi:MAG TPA: hypothetical protein VFW96_02635 [Thermomicrobiales bacterium]|nr:hypothetical protein [Thermomicrobiales bacterium]